MSRFASTSPIEHLEDRRLLAAELFADITPAGIEPKDFFAVGGRVVFTAEQEPFGRALWSSDGTAAGTQMIKDFTRDASDAVIADFVSLNDTALFFASGTLYQTDGTPRGTYRLGADEIVSRSKLVDFGNHVYFSAGDQLWRSDGTAVNTRVIFTLQGNLRLEGATQQFLFFTEFDQQRIWRSDGTLEGTVVHGGTGRSYSDDDVAFGENVFYFRRFDDGGTQTLLRSEGSEAFTEIANADDLSIESTIGDDLYFATYTAVPEAATTLWHYSSNALRQVLTTEPYGPVINQTARVGSKLLVVRDYDQLFLIDPQNGEPQLLRDFGPDLPPSRLNELSRASPYGLVAAGETGAFFFSERNLWKTDLTPEGTRQIGARNRPVAGLPFTDTIGDPVFNRGQLFLPEFDQSGRLEVGVSDGKSSPRIVRDFSGGAPFNVSAPLAPVVAGDSLYFLSELRVASSIPFSSDDHFVLLWKSDGDSAPTIVRAIPNNPEQEASLYSMGSTVFISVGSGNGSFQLWRSNGTEKGTKRVARSFSEIRWFAATSDRVFFATLDRSPDSEQLWATDGSAEGTVLLREYNSYNGISAFRSPINFNGRLHFVADGEIFKSTGTTGSTRRFRLPTMTGPDAPAEVQSIAELNARIYFGATLNSGTAALLQTDGTVAGTGIVKYLNEGESVDIITSIGESLYIGTSTSQSNARVFRSSGTARGTQLLRGTFTDVSGEVDYFKRAGEKVYFGIGRSIASLHVTDGTPGGTLAIRDRDDIARAYGAIEYDGRLFYSSFRDFLAVEQSAPREVFEDAFISQDDIVALKDSIFFTVNTSKAGLWKYTASARVSGTVFSDTDLDAERQSSEQGLAGFRVYVDADNDGRFDAGERFSRTTRTGAFEIFDLDPGVHRLRVTPVDGRAFTTPDVYTIRVRNLDDRFVRRFGVA